MGPHFRFAFAPFAVACCSALALAAALPGCSKDDGTGKTKDGEHGDHGDHGQGFLSFCDLPASCRAIVTACHTKDNAKNADIHACHETAHGGGMEAECDAVRDDCVTKCEAAPDLGSDEELETCEGGAAPDGG